MENFNFTLDKDSILRFKVDNRYFEDNNYVFQKLYAMEYPVYHKEVTEYHIWCWLDNKDISIKDWENDTGIIVNYYLNNRQDMKKSTIFKDFFYMTFYFNVKTKEFVVDESKKYMKNFEEYEKYILKYSSRYWQKITLTRLFDNVVNELKRLTKN